jgi:hypothetical protein
MVVMPGLEPGIYVSCVCRGDIDGRISPAMTKQRAGTNDDEAS